MVLAGLYALCFLGIEYSRFAWNPNSLVFFNLLYFYALLNIFDSPLTTENIQKSANENIISQRESVVRGKSIKYKLRWIIIAGLSFAVSTQLHFLSFATLPVITVVFFLFSRKEIKKNLGWKKILLFFGVIILVYLPVAVNEIITYGKNTDAFFAAIKSKPSHHSLWQNILRDFRYWGQNWFLIITSWISKKASLKPAIIAWLGMIIPGLLLAAKFYRAEKNSFKKKFLLMAILWFLAYFLIYIPISYQIRPRFFLPLLALPFLFIGFIAKYFWEKNRNIWKIPVVAVLAIILVGNLYGTYLWFKEIKSAQKKGVYPQRTIILKARDGIVLWHFEKAAEYIKRDCDKPLVYTSTNSEYKSPVKYVLSLANMNAVSIENFDGGKDGCFYAFGLTRSKNFSLKNKEKFDILSQSKFGALTVYKLNPKEGESPFSKGEKEGKSSRIFWKDVLK